MAYSVFTLSGAKVRGAATYALEHRPANLAHAVLVQSVIAAGREIESGPALAVLVVGGNTIEAQHDIGIEVSSKLLKYSNNGSTLGAVNFPEVSLPAHPGHHRLLHKCHARRRCRRGLRQDRELVGCG